ncbi:hypothetical protein SSX86_001717 [Deinandra increscens subsp. villosa]|uniref:Ubiquitin-like protease family profile domain-containing protein n=1 Tax=Deinandra increscens subsp. villosa TaxID=3103831 RepID=A0AAP0DWQ6_9ASTR
MEAIKRFGVRYSDGVRCSPRITHKRAFITLKNDVDTPIYVDDSGTATEFLDIMKEKGKRAKVDTTVKVSEKEAKKQKGKGKEQVVKDRGINNRKESLDNNSGDDFMPTKRLTGDYIPAPRRPGFYMFTGERILPRNTPKNICDYMSKLSKKQIEVVKKLVFGSMCLLKLRNIPTELAFWLVKNYDPTSNTLNTGNTVVTITPSLVHRVLGIPNGPDYVEEIFKPNTSDPVVADFREQFGDDSLKIKLTRVVDVFEKNKGGVREFVLNFLVVFNTVIIETMQSSTINQRFLTSITTDSVVSRIDNDSRDIVMIDMDVGMQGLSAVMPVNVLSVDNNSGELIEGSDFEHISNWVMDSQDIQDFKDECVTQTQLERNAEGEVVLRSCTQYDVVTEGVDVVNEDVRDDNDEEGEINGLASNEQTPHEKCVEEVIKVKNDAGRKKLSEIEHLVEIDILINNFCEAGKGVTDCIRLASIEHPESDAIKIKKKDWEVTLQKMASNLNTVDVGNLSNAGHGVELEHDMDKEIRTMATPVFVIPGTIEAVEKATDSYLKEKLVAEEKDKVERTVYKSSIFSDDEQQEHGNKEDEVTGNVVFTSKYGGSISRVMMESLILGMSVHPEVVNGWAVVQNYEDQFRSTGAMSRLFSLVVDVRIYGGHMGCDARLALFRPMMDKTLKAAGLKSLKGIDLVFIPYVFGEGYYLLCFKLSNPEIYLLDNNKNLDADHNNIYFGWPELLTGVFAGYLKEKKHPRASKIKGSEIKCLQMPWMDIDNFVDSGVYVMRHMETFEGTEVTYWKCLLSNEELPRQMELNDLRRK